MKKLKWMVAFLIPVMATSCLDSERVDDISFQMIPVDSIDIGAVNNVREVTEIKTYFTRTSACQDFFDYDVVGWGNERRVTVITSMIENDTCSVISEAANAVLHFRPERTGEYHFKFWQGNDEENNPIFLEKTIYIQ